MHDGKDVIYQVEVFLQVLTGSTESSSNVHVHMHHSGWQCSHGSWKSRRLLSVLRVHSMSVWFIPLDTIRSGGWRKVFVPRFLFSQVVSHAFRIQSVCDVGSLVLRLTPGLQCWLRNLQVYRSNRRSCDSRGQVKKVLFFVHTPPDSSVSNASSNDSFFSD